MTMFTAEFKEYKWSNYKKNTTQHECTLRSSKEFYFQNNSYMKCLYLCCLHRYLYARF